MSQFLIEGVGFDVDSVAVDGVAPQERQGDDVDGVLVDKFLGKVGTAIG
jgi:hypothetical protein